MFDRLIGFLFGTASAASPAATEWMEGGLYVTPRENGAYVPLKILKVDADGVHVRIYSNVYPEVPARIDESTLYMAGIDQREDEPMGMGHLPISLSSFSTWGAVLVQPSSVSDQELEGYALWLEANGGYF